MPCVGYHLQDTFACSPTINSRRYWVYLKYWTLNLGLNGLPLSTTPANFRFWACSDHNLAFPVQTPCSLDSPAFSFEGAAYKERSLIHEPKTAQYCLRGPLQSSSGVLSVSLHSWHCQYKVHSWFLIVMRAAVDVIHVMRCCRRASGSQHSNAGSDGSGLEGGPSSQGSMSRLSPDLSWRIKAKAALAARVRCSHVL